MTLTSADLNKWAAHRRAVVYTVARRVPGIDPELAASRGLELLCVELLRQSDVPDPVTFWCAAAIQAALEMAHAEPVPDVLAALDDTDTAPVRRALDFEMLAMAMERLPAVDQQLLWDHHVGSRPVAAIAEEIGVLPYAAQRRLRRAENRLASSFAETHSGTADNLECESTRASMHEFVRNRLLPRRRQQVEDHVVQCSGCTRAFIDVRESYWMLRTAAPILLLGAASATKASTAVAVAGGGIGSGLAAVGTRVALSVRSALTDPVSLTATVASGIFLTAAVTTGVVRDTGSASTSVDTGVVSVFTPNDTKTVPRDAMLMSRAKDSASRPGPTPTVTPSPAKSNEVPPGLARTDGEPPGLAKKNGTPPGLAKTDGQPPGQAKKDSTPPGQAKKDKTPPSQAKKDDPPSATSRTGAPPAPPGHARSRSTSTS